MIGVAFGIGRAIPVLAWRRSSTGPSEQVHRADGRAAGALSRRFASATPRPSCLLAAALTATATATAARTEVPHGADPSAAAKALVFQRHGRTGVERLGGTHIGLPGRDPAIGGHYIAVISGTDEIKILDRFTRKTIGSGRAGAGAPAISFSLARLPRSVERRSLLGCCARRINGPDQPRATRRESPRFRARHRRAPEPRRRDVSSMAVSRRHRNSIKRLNLNYRKGGHGASLLVPSELAQPGWLDRGHLLYVRVARGPEPPLATHPQTAPAVADDQADRGWRARAAPSLRAATARRTLWTTALTASRAYVTVLGRKGPRIVSVHR